jgi:hypothetical protein
VRGRSSHELVDRRARAGAERERSIWWGGPASNPLLAAGIAGAARSASSPDPTKSNALDSKPLAYLALYDKDNIYLEKTRSKQFSPDVLRSIIELAELEELISLASDATRSARRILGSDAVARYGQRVPTRFIESYGACYSALQGLRAERSERIEKLRARSCDVTEETARDLGQEGKLSQVVNSKAQWVRDFQSGKAPSDSISEVFFRPERILKSASGDRTGSQV